MAGGDKGQLHYGGWRGGIALSRAGGSADNQDICRPTLSNYGCGPATIFCQFDPGTGSVWLTTMSSLPWRYEGPTFSPPSVWLSPDHLDWGRLCTEATEGSSLSWHPPSATMRMPWSLVGEGIDQEPNSSCQGQCKETIAFLSSRDLQHQFQLDCSERRVRRLEEEKKTLQRRLALKEVMVEWMRTVLQRYSLGAGSLVNQLRPAGWLIGQSTPTHF